VEPTDAARISPSAGRRGNKMAKLKPGKLEERRNEIVRMWDEGKSFAEIRKAVEAKYKVGCNHETMKRATGYTIGVPKGQPITKANARKYDGVYRKSAAQVTGQFAVAPMVLDAARDHARSLERLIREVRKAMLDEGIERLEVTRTEARAHKTEVLSY
jgi:hypothetical protein